MLCKKLLLDSCGTNKLYHRHICTQENLTVNTTGVHQVSWDVPHTYHGDSCNNMYLIHSYRFKKNSTEYMLPQRRTINLLHLFGTSIFNEKQICKYKTGVAYNCPALSHFVSTELIRTGTAMATFQELNTQNLPILVVEKSVSHKQGLVPESISWFYSNLHRNHHNISTNSIFFMLIFLFLLLLIHKFKQLCLAAGIFYSITVKFYSSTS